MTEVFWVGICVVYCYLRSQNGASKLRFICVYCTPTSRNESDHQILGNCTCFVFVLISFFRQSLSLSLSKLFASGVMESCRVPSCRGGIKVEFLMVVMHGGG